MKILGLANNYKGMPEDDKEPVIFWKGDQSTYRMDGMEIKIPENFGLVWPEVELVIVNTVNGIRFAVGNDITAASLEDRDVHLPKSKAIKTFFPVSFPFVSTYNINALMTLTVNGEIVQKDYLYNIRYNPTAAMRLVEKYFNIEFGDVITTGTPPHPYFNLSDGDLVVAEIEGVGRVENRVRRL